MELNMHGRGLRVEILEFWGATQANNFKEINSIETNFKLNNSKEIKCHMAFVI